MRYLLILLTSCYVSGQESKPHITDRSYQLKDNKIYQIVRDKQGKVWYAECGERKWLNKRRLESSGKNMKMNTLQEVTIMDKFIQFCIAVLANLVALTLYGIITYTIWRAIW